MKKVCIIGGGISGIASAIFLSRAGYDVSLFESTSKLGGRTYSVSDRYLDATYDNGKHIFAGWYKDTLELLNILGTKDKVTNSRFRLAIAHKDVLLMSDARKRFSLFNYLLMLRKTGLIRWIDLWRVFIQYNKIKSINDTVSYKMSNFLQQQKVSDNLSYYFWVPLVHSIFNCDLEDVNIKVIKNLMLDIGFNRTKLSFFCSDKTLNEIFIQPAINFFHTYGVKYYLNSKVSKFLLRDGKIDGIAINGEIKNNFDYYISAVRADQFGFLIDGFSQSEKILIDSFHFNPIISVHLFIDDNLFNNKLKEVTSLMLAIFQPIPLWLFKNGQNYLSFIISNARKYIDYDRNQMLYLCIKVLRENNLVDLNERNIKHFSVVKERFATIVPEHSRLGLQFFSDFLPPNLLVCGDWTSKLGFSTIEAAISSSKLVVKKLDEIEGQH
ncbi:MAG: FAD-dependent oxidoreductase [Ignavibacteria bacterium]